MLWVRSGEPSLVSRMPVASLAVVLVCACRLSPCCLLSASQPVPMLRACQSVLVRASRPSISGGFASSGCLFCSSVVSDACLSQWLEVVGAPWRARVVWTLCRQSSLRRHFQQQLLSQHPFAVIPVVPPLSAGASPRPLCWLASSVCGHFTCCLFAHGLLSRSVFLLSAISQVCNVVTRCVASRPPCSSTSPLFLCHCVCLALDSVLVSWLRSLSPCQPLGICRFPQACFSACPCGSSSCPYVSGTYPAPVRTQCETPGRNGPGSL